MSIRISMQEAMKGSYCLVSMGVGQGIANIRQRVVVHEHQRTRADMLLRQIDDNLHEFFVSQEPVLPLSITRQSLKSPKISATFLKTANVPNNLHIPVCATYPQSLMLHAQNKTEMNTRICF